MDTLQPKKMDLRIVKTHRALNEAFLALLEEEPLSDITVNELCIRADIRRATFYKHFADKNAFIEYAVLNMHRSFTKEAENHPENDGTLTAFFLGYARQTMQFLRTHERLVQRVRETNMLPHLLSILLKATYREILERIKAEAAKGTELPAMPEVLASFCTGGLYQTLQYWQCQEGSMSEDELLNQLSHLLTRL